MRNLTNDETEYTFGRNLSNDNGEILSFDLSANLPLVYTSNTDEASVIGLKGLNALGTANQILAMDSSGTNMIFKNDSNTEYTGTDPIDICGTVISLKGLNGFTANKIVRCNSAGTAFEYADDNVVDLTTALNFGTAASGIVTFGNSSQITKIDGNINLSGTIFTQTFFNNTIKIGNANSSQGFIQFQEDTDNGSNYVILQPAASLGDNFTLTLPSKTATLATTADTFFDLSTNNVNLYPNENTYNLILGNKNYNNTNDVKLVIEGDMEITGKMRSQDSTEIYIEWNDNNGIELYARDTGSAKSFNLAFRNSGQAGSGKAFPYIGCAGTNGSSLAIFITNESTTHTLFNSDLSTTHNGNLVCNNNISVKNGATSSGSVSFFEDSDFGSNSIKLQAPLTAIGSDKILTLPDVTATLSYNGQNISLFNNDEGFIDSAGVSSQIASAENISTASILFNPNRTFGNALSATFINGSSINITGTALKIGNGSTNAGKIQFLENTSGGSNSITLKPHAETFGDLEITLPSSDGQLALTSSLSGFITASSTDNLTNKTITDLLKVLVSTTGSHTIAELLSPSLSNTSYNELKLGVNSSANNHGILNFYYDSAGD